MTTTPTFDDLTLPSELMEGWVFGNRGPMQSMKAAARWGWERGRQLWPEPIGDRPPTAEDGDDNEAVQYQDSDLSWRVIHWAHVGHRAWQHTPRWQPRQPSPVDTLAAIIREVDGNHRLGAGALAEAILAHPDARRALEQAGEEQA
jgi:hypothetical protein